MPRRTLIAHLSDPHVGATWGGDADPVARLATTVAAIRALRPAPDAVLVTGDLADHATHAEYAAVEALLGRLNAPVHVLPGNHDDRATLRAHFGVPGAPADPVQHAQDVGPVRVVLLDTTIPGADPGRLDEDRLGWLDAELARAPDAPTLVAMHHTPVSTGVPAEEAGGLPAADREALGAVVARHPQVRRLLTGHLHRPVLGDLAGRPVLTVPATYVQARVHPVTQDMGFADDPPAFALHAVTDGTVVSTVHVAA